MRILIVEDEPDIADFIRRGLTEAGFAVDVASDGLEALEFVRAAPYEAVIADIMMPRLDGLQLVAALRDGGRSLPILLLTARDSVPQRVEGLNTGADDYLVKPFVFAELLARLRALLRRPSQQLGVALRVGELCLDSVQRQAFRGERALVLSQREFALLEFLMRHVDQVLTRDQIIEGLWSYEVEPGSNVVDVYVGNLRRKMEAGGAARLIHTEYGVGYRLSSPAGAPLPQDGGGRR